MPIQSLLYKLLHQIIAFLQCCTEIVAKNVQGTGQYNKRNIFNNISKPILIILRAGDHIHIVKQCQWSSHHNFWKHADKALQTWVQCTNLIILSTIIKPLIARACHKTPHIAWKRTLNATFTKPSHLHSSRSMESAHPTLSIEEIIGSRCWKRHCTTAMAALSHTSHDLKKSITNMSHNLTI